MKVQQSLEKAPKFFDISEMAPKLKPLKQLFPWVERIVGLEWLYKKTEVLRGRYSSNISAALPELFPCLNIDNCISMPQENPLIKPGGKIIVANHEGFWLDAIFLSWLLAKYRSDFKYIATSEILCPLFADSGFFLDIRLAHQKNPGRNVVLYQQVVNWLKEGKMIVIFPDIHAVKKKNWQWSKKLPWSSLPHSLAKITGVPIIPIKLNIPSSSLFRVLNYGLLFFYNIKLVRMARACHVLCGVFSCRQVKFASGKKVSCIIGSELMPGVDKTQGNDLRDSVYQLCGDCVQ